jgi:hypothetical protein
MEWQKVNRETAIANYDSSARVFNDDGSLPESGLRLIIDEAKKTAKLERMKCLPNSGFPRRRSLDSKRSAKGTGN